MHMKHTLPYITWGLIQDLKNKGDPDSYIDYHRSQKLREEIPDINSNTKKTYR